MTIILNNSSTNYPSPYWREINEERSSNSIHQQVMLYLSSKTKDIAAPPGLYSVLKIKLTVLLNKWQF